MIGTLVLDRDRLVFDSESLYSIKCDAPFCCD